MGITENILNINRSLKEGVRLIAVSKTKTKEEIMEAYRCGQRAFGENKVQELVDKYNALPKDIEWHFIGHLQGNKVRPLVPFVHLVHSIDSFKLLKSVNKEGKRINRVIPCLLQFHIAREETKFGFDPDEAVGMLSSPDYAALDFIRLHGVMGMATFTPDEIQIRNEFRMLKQFFDGLKRRFFPDKDFFREISMGMSGDYQPAMEEGSTMIRVGSLIFGERH